MTKFKSILLTSALSLAFGVQAHAECDAPAAPIIPDGNVASQDELVSAQKAMKVYQGSLIDYRECLAGMESEVVPETEGSAEKSAEILNQYNASVDTEAAVAEEFNEAVRAFKAR